jgi:hypothetical protein
MQTKNITRLVEICTEAKPGEEKKMACAIKSNRPRKNRAKSIELSKK